jgi:hypothetical protein
MSTNNNTASAAERTEQFAEKCFEAVRELTDEVIRLNRAYAKLQEDNLSLRFALDEVSN